MKKLQCLMLNVECLFTYFNTFFYFGSAMSSLVCYTAVFSVVTQRSRNVA